MADRILSPGSCSYKTWAPRRRWRDDERRASYWSPTSSLTLNMWKNKNSRVFSRYILIHTSSNGQSLWKVHKCLLVCDCFLSTPMHFENPLRILFCHIYCVCMHNRDLWHLSLVSISLNCWFVCCEFKWRVLTRGMSYYETKWKSFY